MQILEKTYTEQVGYNTERGSDKEYRINVIALENGEYGLRCYNGRRGRATAVAQSKDFSSYDDAVESAEKFRLEKTKKHYVFESGKIGETPVSNFTRIDTKLRPQLLNAITKEEANLLKSDNRWCLQRKYNGENLLIRHENDGSVTYATKDGYATTVPKNIDDTVRQYPQMLLCTEILGSRCAVFDILELDNADLRDLTFQERQKIYQDLLVATDQRSPLFPVYTAFSEEEKEQLRQDIINHDGEGECWKLLTSTYEPGKPAKNGPQRKCKAWKSANVIVIAHNDKRSVKIAVWDGMINVAIGNVTIPANKDIPPIDATIEVRYQDYFPGGALTQTSYLHERESSNPDDYAISQLKSLERER